MFRWALHTPASPTEARTPPRPLPLSSAPPSRPRDGPAKRRSRRTTPPLLWGRRGAPPPLPPPWQRRRRRRSRRRCGKQRESSQVGSMNREEAQGSSSSRAVQSAPVATVSEAPCDRQFQRMRFTRRKSEQRTRTAGRLRRCAGPLKTLSPRGRALCGYTPRPTQTTPPSRLGSTSSMSIVSNVPQCPITTIPVPHQRCRGLATNRHRVSGAGRPTVPRSRRRVYAGPRWRSGSEPGAV